MIVQYDVGCIVMLGQHQENFVVNIMIRLVKNHTEYARLNKHVTVIIKSPDISRKRHFAVSNGQET